MKIVSTDDLDKNLKLKRRRALNLLKEEASLQDLERLQKDIEKRKAEGKSVPARCNGCGRIWPSAREKHIGTPCAWCNRGLANDLGGELVRMTKEEIITYQEEQKIKGQMILNQMRKTQKIKAEDFERRAALGEFD